MSVERARLRLALSRLGFLVAAWTTILAATHGIAFSLGPLHFSSRAIRNPAIAAALILIGAIWAAPAGTRLQTVAQDIVSGLLRVAGVGRSLRRLGWIFAALTHPRLLTTLAVFVSLLPLALSWQRGALVVGGADSYGYVSEAHLFATGRLRMELPHAHAFPHIPMTALTPLGYRPADDGSNTLVPTYSPGLPLTMAVAERIAGMDAVYAVMPLLGALAVWCAYWIGAQLVGPGVGLAAALLVSASPAFAFQIVGAPLSDIPAAGWWALALALLLRDRRWSTAAAGAAAGLAIMTRPNLLLVMVVLGLYLVWQVFDDVAQRRERITRLVLFSIPGAAGCLVVAWFNAVWNGSPLRSGYPPGLFGASYWDDNILHFSRWLSETQTPLFFIGFLAPFATRWLPSPSGVKLRAAATLLVGVMLAVFASYLFYLPFDAWWYLRFLLPGYPALAVATCIALAAVAQRFGPAARVVVIAAVAVVIAFGLSEVGKTELLGENRYRLIGEWVRDRLPANAIVFTSQHSGNVNHYSGRPIVRYDLIANTDYQSALQEIVAAGYHPYLVIDEWETQSVRDHAAGPHGALDWPPIAELQLGNVVKVWDLGVDPDAARASQRAPEIVPIPESIRQQLR